MSWVVCSKHLFNLKSVLETGRRTLNEFMLSYVLKRYSKKYSDGDTSCWTSILYLAPLFLFLFEFSRFSWFLSFCFPSILSDLYLLLFLLHIVSHLNFQFWHSLGFHFLASSPILFRLFKVISSTFKILPLSWWTFIQFFQLRLLSTFSYSDLQPGARPFCIPHSHIYPLAKALSFYLYHNSSTWAFQRSPTPSCFHQ